MKRPLPTTTTANSGNGSTSVVHSSSFRSTTSKLSSSAYVKSRKQVSIPTLKILVFLVITIGLVILSCTLTSSITRLGSTTTTTTNDKDYNERPTDFGSCAINLYGLPRAFQSLVLPSLIRHVIRPNLKYGCDYYIHYYQQTSEASGRSGTGGTIDPQQVLLLTKAIQQQVANQRQQQAESTTTIRMPHIQYSSTLESDFWTMYADLIDTIHTTKDPKTGKYKYFPTKAQTYHYPSTVDNILKMWHSIQSVFQLMLNATTSVTNTENDNLTTDTKTLLDTSPYRRVAMLRLDVVYVTDLDMYQARSDLPDPSNDYVVIPGFGRHPISDRLIVGPIQAVSIWAQERFSRLEEHVQYTQAYDPGFTMHSERFVNATLLGAIRKELMQGPKPIVKDIVEHDTLCFFRARADESVWIRDCHATDPAVAMPSIYQQLGGSIPAIRQRVETTLGRKCHDIRIFKKPYTQALDCSIHGKTTTDKH